MRVRGFIFGLMAITVAACSNNGTTNNEQGASKTDTATAPATPKMAQANNALPTVPAGAKVFFVNLKDEQTVTSPFKVEMGVSGMMVDSAGHVKQGYGHHHLLIDAGDSLARGTAVPKDATHLHFGEAQTETMLTLPAGKHKLTLQFADGMHRSYGSQMAATITVNVK